MVQKPSVLGDFTNVPVAVVTSALRGSNRDRSVSARTPSYPYIWRFNPNNDVHFPSSDLQPNRSAPSALPPAPSESISSDKPLYGEKALEGNPTGTEQLKEDDKKERNGCKSIVWVKSEISKSGLESSLSCQP